MTDAEMREACRRQHNFWLDFGPGRRLFIHVPHSIDPADNKPLVAVRMASDAEITLWEDGPDGWAKLAVILQRQGLPVKMPKRASVWGKALDGLRRLVGAGAGVNGRARR